MRRAAFPFTDLQVALVKAHADYSHRTDFPIFECFTPDLSWLTKPIYSLLVMALLFRLVKTEDPTTLIGHTSLTRGTTHTSRTFMPPRARTGCCDNTAACHAHKHAVRTTQSRESITTHRCAREFSRCFGCKQHYKSWLKLGSGRFWRQSCIARTLLVTSRYTQSRDIACLLEQCVVFKEELQGRLWATRRCSSNNAGL